MPKKGKMGKKGKGKKGFVQYNTLVTTWGFFSAQFSR